MKTITKGLLFLIVVMLAVALLAGCETGAAKKDWRSVGSKPFHGVPVPADAEKIKSDSLGQGSGRWGGAYANEMTMAEAAKWYEKKLAAAGLKFEKLPEKPADEGYTIFNMTKGAEQLQVVIVSDTNKTGVNIQVTGEPAN